MDQATIEAFNKFYEATAELCNCITNEFIDLIKMIADKLDEVVEIIENTNEKATASNRIRFIESYKKPVKDYLIIFEILKIPIIKIEYQKKENLIFFSMTKEAISIVAS